MVYFLWIECGKVIGATVSRPHAGPVIHIRRMVLWKVVIAVALLLEFSCGIYDAAMWISPEAEVFMLRDLLGEP